MNELFLKLINMSISASWLILAVLILRLVLKKAPKWVNVLLWGIVAVRLLFPFSVESALSLIPSAETIRPEIMMDAAPTINTGIPAINSAVNPVISQSFAPSPGASANPLQIWIPVLTIVWVIGVVGLFVYTAVTYWRLRRKVGTAVLLRGNIFQSESVSSPFVLGIIRPKIYLPFKIDKQDIGHVLAHELAHIRRRDHWWKPLGFLLMTIHWFNPLMWLAYVLLCRDIELACDEKVIKALGSEQRADYTQALLTCSVNRRMVAACPLAFGEVGVKERVKSVMNYKKPAFWIIVLAVVACAVVAVCFLTDPKGSADEDIFVKAYMPGELYYGNSPGFPDYVTLSRDGSLDFIWFDEAWPMGTLTETALDRDRFDQLFHPVNDANALRRQNQKLWQTEPMGDTMYLLLLQRSGELYLAECYYDAEGETDPYSDDSSVRWMCQLVPEDAADGVMLGHQVAVGEVTSIQPVEVPGLALTLDKSAYFWGEPIGLTLTNGTDDTYTLNGSLGAFLQVLADGQWHELVINGDWVMTMTGRIYPPGYTLKETLPNIYQMYGDVAIAGRYRLVIPASRDTDGENFYLAAEFDIVEYATPADTTAVIECSAGWQCIPVGYAEGLFSKMFELGGAGERFVRSSVRDLPVVRINSTEELRALAENLSSYVDLDYSAYPDVPAFASAAKAYDDSFFEASTLFLIYITEGTTAVRHSVAHVRLSNRMLSIGIERLDPGAGDMMMEGWLIAVAVPTDQITDADEADAHVCSPWCFLTDPKSDEETSPGEIKASAAQILADADTVSSYVTEYDLGERHILTHIPLAFPPSLAAQLDTIRGLLHGLDLSGFELYSEEPGTVEGAFLVHNEGSFIKVEIGYALTREELQQAMGLPEEVVLTFFFTDTGESMRLIGPNDGTVANIWAMTDQRTGTNIITWQRTYPDTWMVESGNAYPMANVVLYTDDATTLEQSYGGNMLYLSAMLASVMENAPAVLTPIAAPTDFHIDREFEIIGRDYGVGAYDLERDILRVDDQYYDLTQMDASGLTYLHAALLDGEYGPKQ